MTKCLEHQRSDIDVHESASLLAELVGENLRIAARLLLPNPPNTPPVVVPSRIVVPQPDPRNLRRVSKRHFDEDD